MLVNRGCVASRQLAQSLGLSRHVSSSCAQRTVAVPLTFEGVGLHSGKPCSMTLMPSKPNSGIVFSLTEPRTRQGDDAVQASWDRVIDTTLSTVIAKPASNKFRRWVKQVGFRAQRLGFQRLGHKLCGFSVATIEHLMAALSSQRIHNAHVILSSDELPIMDGSSAAFSAALSDRAAITTALSDGGEACMANVVEILRSVSVNDGRLRFATMSPWQARERAASDDLEISVEIDFGDRIQDGAGGRQFLSFERREFVGDVAGARTFCFEEEVARMRRAGLARGGSLDNAVVYDRAGRVVNAGGLRYEDEAVRHKGLDALGDLALGGALVGRFHARRPGHALNHRLLAALFAAPENYRIRPANRPD